MLLDMLLHLDSEIHIPLTCFLRSSLPDVESFAREMEPRGLLLEVSGCSRLNPTYVNHLQALSPFQRLDVAAQSIKECLMRWDHMSLRA